MVDLDRMTVTLGAQTQDIMSFETWWVVPGHGMATSLDDAKKAMLETGLPFNLVKPVTVALCKGGLYEVML